MTNELQTHGRKGDLAAGIARSNVPAWVCGIVLGLSMFVVNYSLAIRFDQLKVFEQHNVLFHADPMWRVQSFSTGYGWSDRNLVHPNLGNFFSMPNRIVAMICVMTGVYDGDEKDVRRINAILLVPCFSAATVITIFSLLYQAGLSLWQAMLIAFMGGCSFSQLIFGSIPDHFAIGGFCIAAGCWLAVDLMKSNGRVRWVLWTGLGILTLGVTVTNIIWVGILFATSLIVTRQEWKLTLKYLTIWSAAVVAVTLLVAQVGALVHGQHSSVLSVPEAYYDAPEKGIRRLADAPSALANTFVPLRVKTQENRLANLYDFGRRYRFTLEGSSGVFQIVTILSLIIAGAIGSILKRGVLRSLSVACIVIVALNLVMHAILGPGNEYFAFSQHWLAPALVLMAGSFSHGSRCLIVGTMCLISVATFMVFNNSSLINEMLCLLSIDVPA